MFVSQTVEEYTIRAHTVKDRSLFISWGAAEDFRVRQ